MSLTGLPWLTVVSLALIALLRSSIAAALDPGRPLSQVQVDVWNIEDGLPQDTVTTIVRTRDGHLWFGTYDGLVRFDGARFTVFDGRTTPLLATGSTFSLMEDRDGALWIGRSENVLVYRNGVFQKVLGAEELGQGSVWSLCQAPDGTIWGGASRGLLRWKDGQVTLFGKAQGLPAARFRSVCVDRDGTVWIGTNGAGLVALRSGEVSIRSTKNGFPGDEIITVLPDPRGGVWAATAGAGLVRVVGGSQRIYGRAEGLPTDQLTALAFERGGALWIGTWGSGVCRLRNDAVSCLGSTALSNDKIWSILPDDEGFVWIGTWVGGLNRLRDRSFPVYGVPEGLSNDNVRAVLHGRDGSVWLATAGGGLNRLRDGRIEVLRKTDGLPSDEVSALCEDRSGALWVGTYTSGLARLRAGRIERFEKSQGLPGLDVRVILEDRLGTVWVATTLGVARTRDGHRFERLESPEWLSLNSVVCALEDRQGALWFGTSGDGLVRYDAAGFRAYTIRDGLLSDRISALHEDAEGVLWIGTAWSGLNRLENGRLSAIRPEDGLAEGRVQVILEDGGGGLWFTGNKGFERLSKKELAAVAARRPVTLHPLAFGLRDGLRSVSFASGQQPVGSIGPDGRIWLPSYRGVVVVDPGRLPATMPPPGVRLEEVLVDGTPRTIRDALVVGPGRPTVELRYSAATLQPAERILFRFRLEGYETAWHDVETRRSAYYTGLPPGRYRFRAACQLREGQWGPESDLLRVVVRPAFHETTWFRALGLVLALAGAFGAVRVRTVQLRRRQVELERLVAERTEELSRANERLSGLSFSDALTGVANRRRFDETLEDEWKRAIRFNHPLSLVMVDLDGFKSYNDEFGHPAGDRCLVDVAKVIHANARRAADLAARYGGEEFVLLLPATPPAEAVSIAERVREEIEALGIPQHGRPKPIVTASLGVATIVPNAEGGPARLVAEADAALYGAKAAGRNRVVSAARTI